LHEKIDSGKRLAIVIALSLSLSLFQLREFDAPLSLMGFSFHAKGISSFICSLNLFVSTQTQRPPQTQATICWKNKIKNFSLSIYVCVLKKMEESNIQARRTHKEILWEVLRNC
jgi:hypothetical protein